MTVDVVFILAGASLLLAVVLPVALSRAAVSAPIVLLVVGALIGLLPLPEGVELSPVANRSFVEHLTEFCVLFALMGVGLALDRPLDLRRLGAWRKWGADLAAARDRDAADHRRGGRPRLVGDGPRRRPRRCCSARRWPPPTPSSPPTCRWRGPPPPTSAEQEEIDESDEVRFALTSEAGLNDGLAFPFVYAAIFLATLGPVTEWGLRWLAWDLVGKTLLGVLVGLVVGWVLAKVAFRAPRLSLRLAETGEPLLALAAVLLSYGVAEVVSGYGFLAVFACAMTLRSAERGHDYHAHMHQTIERLERLFTLAVLLILGVAMTNGLLSTLTWPAVAVAFAAGLRGPPGDRVPRALVAARHLPGRRPRADPRRARRDRVLRGARGGVAVLPGLRHRRGRLRGLPGAVVHGRLHDRALGARARGDRDPGDAPAGAGQGPVRPDRPAPRGGRSGQSTRWPYISPSGSAISSTRAPSGSVK